MGEGGPGAAAGARGRVVCVTDGSYGDVLPFLAIASRLAGGAAGAGQGGEDRTGGRRQDRTSDPKGQRKPAVVSGRQRSPAIGHVADDAGWRSLVLLLVVCLMCDLLDRSSLPFSAPRPRRLDLLSLEGPRGRAFPNRIELSQV